eukprot:COSAG01_NODE_60638_length_293_cov_1.582474_1_plen_27_part_01
MQKTVLAKPEREKILLSDLIRSQYVDA